MASTEPVIDNPTEPSIKLLTGAPAETYTAKPTASPTEPAKDFVSETPTEASCESCTEHTTEASVKPVSMPAPATSTETIESSTRTTDDPVSETSTKTTTELSTESCTSPATESCVEPVTIPVSETATEDTTESSTHTANDPTFETSTEPVTEASPEPSTEAATESCTAPTTESCVESLNMTTTATASEPTAESLTQPASVLTPEIPIKLSDEGSSESSSDSSTGAGDDSSTETANKSGTKKFVAVEGKDALEHLARIEEIPAVDMLTPRSTVPCSACNFSPERQRCCDYESDVKIFYEASDRGVWALGSDLILKDRGPMLPTDESANLRFVKENTTIPVPTVITHRAGKNGHALTIITRIPGEPLNEAWPKLTDDEKENIAKQTAEYLLQLRALQSDRIEGLDGRPIYSDYLYTEDGRQYAPCPPLKSDDDVWNGMAARLNPDLPEAVRRRLRRFMPPTKPFTFTHNDLTHVNIMVQNGELAGIIDWERAGYFPVWWEYIGTILTGEGQDDLDWKSLLAQYMPDMEDAFEWFLDYHNLCKPDLDTRRSKAFIQASEEEESEKNESGVDEPEVDES